MESTDLSFLGAGENIPEIVANSTKIMAQGITEAVSSAFNGLVLNQNGTGLSAFAIWCLTFLGVGFIWKIVPGLIRMVRRGK